MKLEEPNMPSGIMARSPRRFSTQTKASVSTTPAIAHPMANGVQPARPEPIVRPQVSAPNAAVASAPPGRSSAGRSRSRLSCTAISARAMAPAANGRLIRKIARHPTTSISQPPRTGPIADITAPIEAHMPMARPRASPEKLAPRIARLLGIRMAAPMPCNPRPASSKVRPGAAAQRIEAAANRTVPPASSLTRP